MGERLYVASSTTLDGSAPALDCILKPKELGVTISLPGRRKLLLWTNWITITSIGSFMLYGTDMRWSADSWTISIHSNEVFLLGYWYIRPTCCYCIPVCKFRLHSISCLTWTCSVFDCARMARLLYDGTLYLPCSSRCNLLWGVSRSSRCRRVRRG